MEAPPPPTSINQLRNGSLRKTGQLLLSKKSDESPRGASSPSRLDVDDEGFSSRVGKLVGRTYMQKTPSFYRELSMDKYRNSTSARSNKSGASESPSRYESIAENSSPKVGFITKPSLKEDTFEDTKPYNRVRQDSAESDDDNEDLELELDANAFGSPSGSSYTAINMDDVFVSSPNNRFNFVKTVDSQVEVQDTDMKSPSMQTKSTKYSNKEETAKSKIAHNEIVDTIVDDDAIPEIIFDDAIKSKPLTPEKMKETTTPVDKEPIPTKEAESLALERPKTSVLDLLESSKTEKVKQVKSKPKKTKKSEDVVVELDEAAISKILDKITKRIDRKISRGSDWYREIMKACDKKCQRQFLMKSRYFVRGLREGWGLNDQEAIALGSRFHATEGIWMLEFLNLVHPSKPVISSEIEKYRALLEEDSVQRGLSYNMRALYVDAGGSLENGNLGPQAIVSQYENDTLESVAYEIVHAMIAPRLATSPKAWYCDFANFVHDPYFAIDVFPRFQSKMKLLRGDEGCSYTTFRNSVRSSFENSSSEAAVIEALQVLSFDKGDGALSKSELKRIVRRYDADGQKQRWSVDLLCDALFMDLIEASPKPDAPRVCFGEEEPASPEPESPKIEQTFEDSESELSSSSESEDSDEESDQEMEIEITHSATPATPAVTVAPLNFSQILRSRSNANAAFEVSQNALARRLEPVAGDVLDFAVYLGMDPVDDEEWMWLAEECLYAPLPKGWCQARDSGNGDLYYWRIDDEKPNTQWEHPLDPFFRKMFQQLKEERRIRDEDNAEICKTGRWSNNRRAETFRRALTARSMDSADVNQHRLRVLRGAVASAMGKEISILDKPSDSSNAEHHASKILPSAEVAAQNILGEVKKPAKIPVRRHSISTAARSNRIMPDGSILSYTIAKPAATPAPEQKQHRVTFENPPNVNANSHPNTKSAVMAASVGNMLETASASEYLPRHEPFPEDQIRPLWWYNADEFDVVSHRDIMDLACFFNVVLPDEAHLVWILKLASIAPIPDGWRQCGDDYTDDGFFVSENTFKITRCHPLDPFFALLIQSERELETTMNRHAETWSSFYMQDSAEKYYYDFATDSAGPTEPRTTFTPPRIVERMRHAHSDPYILAYKKALWNALMIDGEKTTLPTIVSKTMYHMLDRLALIKIAMVLDMLKEDIQNDLQKALATKEKLEETVQSRRVTSEQLTKHVTQTKTKFLWWW